MRTHLTASWIALPLVAIALSCSDITNLEQEDPSQILAEDVYAPQQAALLVNGAVGDFECAFFRYVTAAGLLGDELVNVIANTTNYRYDRRTLLLTDPYGGAGCNSTQQPGVYTPLSVARASADTILAHLEGWTDAQMPAGVNRTQLIGKAAAYAGYSLVLLGEGLCSAAINVGPELTPIQVFTEAESRFDKAIAAASTAGDQTTLNLARLGRARTLLNLAYAAPNTPASPDLARLGEAATEAGQIPAGFVVNAVASLTGRERQQNIIFLHTGAAAGTSNYSSVDASFAGLAVDTVPDPRVQLVDTGQVGANGVRIRQQKKYADLGAPVPIARTTEAQLIVAEAAIIAGNRAGAVTIINVLHAAADSLPAYDSTGKTNDQILAQVREERRRELFLESQRLGDMRRLGLPLLPVIGTPFPGGGIYGDQRCFPLPAVERNNNPNIPDT